MDKLYGYGDFHGEPLPQTRKETDKNRVFERYTFDKPAPNHLPIYKHKDQILETIEKHAVSIIQGSTGSGKTTQVSYLMSYLIRIFTTNSKLFTLVSTLNIIYN